VTLAEQSSGTSGAVPGSGTSPNPLRIATWNVNSIRARLDRLLAWIERNDIDAVAIQETKVPEEKFPYLMFESIGYQVAHHGSSQWNGVAVASRIGIHDVEAGFPDVPGFGGEESEARAIGVTCGSGPDAVRIWSLYVPNGRRVGDPHYHYKLQWLGALEAAGRRWLVEDPAARIALCGDYNIAPTDDDVWDMNVFRFSTHVTEPERAAFRALNAAGYSDVVRPHTPGEFTYWDYTQLRFARREGMRIDFALCSPALARSVVGARIDRQERKGKGASDHAPVILEIAPTTVDATAAAGPATAGAVAAGPADARTVPATPTDPGRVEARP
jgi:exodeoxyribonuclease-3